MKPNEYKYCPTYPPKVSVNKIMLSIWNITLNIIKLVNEKHFINWWITSLKDEQLILPMKANSLKRKL